MQLFSIIIDGFRVCMQLTCVLIIIIMTVTYINKASFLTLCGNYA